MVFSYVSTVFVTILGKKHFLWWAKGAQKKKFRPKRWVYINLPYEIIQKTLSKVSDELTMLFSKSETGTSE